MSSPCQGERYCFASGVVDARDVRPSLSSCFAWKVKKAERRQASRGHRSDCLPAPWSQGFGEVRNRAKHLPPRADQLHGLVVGKDA